MRDACRWCLLPLQQLRFALVGCGRGQCLLQPGVELLRGHGAGRVEQAQVVVAQAAADDEHAFVAQRRQQAAGGDVGGGVEALQHRELHHRNLRLGVGGLQGGEGAVVEAAFGVEAGRHAAGLQQLQRALRQLGRAGRAVVDLVGVGREAVVVVEHARLGRRRQREVGRLPVRGDHQDCAHLAFVGLGHGLQRGFEAVVAAAGLLAHPGPGAAAVRDVVGGQTGHGAAPCVGGRSSRRPAPMLPGGGEPWVSAAACPWRRSPDSPWRRPESAAGWRPSPASAGACRPGAAVPAARGWRVRARRRRC